MSTNYDIDEKKSIIEIAVHQNSLKFLRHLWNIQNQYYSFSKKTKNSIFLNDNNNNNAKKGKFRRKSLLNLNAGKNSNSDNYKTGVKLFELSDIINSFAESRRQQSIK